jgi:predicted nucleotidyltransferase
MLHLSKTESQIITSILSKYPYKFYAFGSRVKGYEKKYSDLDICYNDKIPLNVKGAIEERFEDSDLTFVVELVDLNLCDQSFKDKIAKDLIPL